MAGKNGKEGDDARITMEHAGQTVETTLGTIREVVAHKMFPFPYPDNVFPKDSKPTLNEDTDALEEIVATLVDDCEEFEELDGIKVRVLYKKGTPDWYARTKVKGEEDVLLAKVDVVILVALERCYVSQADLPPGRGAAAPAALPPPDQRRRQAQDALSRRRGLREERRALRRVAAGVPPV